MRVVIAGGSGGFGRAISDRLIRAGAELVIIDCTPPADASLPYVAADLGTRGSGREALDRVVKEFGLPDSIIYCAAVHFMRELPFFSPPEFDDVMQVNVVGALEIELAWLELIPHSPGHLRTVVNISSAAGIRGSRDIAYGASKAALIAATRSLAKYAVERSVAVVAVVPGIVDSPMSAAMPSWRRDSAIASTMIGRVGQVDEVASIISHLVLEPNMQLSGTVLPVDGGQS